MCGRPAAHCPACCCREVWSPSASDCLKRIVPACHEHHEYGAGIILKALHQLVLKYSYHLWGCTSLGCFMRGDGLSPHYTLVTLHPEKIYKLRNVVWCSTRQHYAIITVVPGFRNVMLLQSSVLQPCVVVQFHTMQSKVMYVYIYIHNYMCVLFGVCVENRMYAYVTYHEI